MPTDSALSEPLPRPPRRPRKAATLAGARLTLSRAMAAAEDLLKAEGLTGADVLRILSGLATASGVYARLVEAAELEGRLDALERALARSQDAP